MSASPTDPDALCWKRPTLLPCRNLRAGPRPMDPAASVSRHVPAGSCSGVVDRSARRVLDRVVRNAFDVPAGGGPTRWRNQLDLRPGQAQERRMGGPGLGGAALPGQRPRAAHVSRQPDPDLVRHRARPPASPGAVALSRCADVLDLLRRARAAPVVRAGVDRRARGLRAGGPDVGDLRRVRRRLPFPGRRHRQGRPAEAADRRPDQGCGHGGSGRLSLRLQRVPGQPAARDLLPGQDAAGVVEPERRRRPPDVVERRLGRLPAAAR